MHKTAVYLLLLAVVNAFCHHFMLYKIQKHFQNVMFMIVGRNGKRNQQKVHIQVCESLKKQRNQRCYD